MKKLIKWLLGTVVFLALLLVLAVVLLPVMFDPNDHKPRIQQMVADSIGREVELNGPIEWSVFPWIAININDVTVANETGFKGDYLAQVEDVSVRVKLLPLLKKEIKVGQVELKHPIINLQVAKSGKSNWQSMIDYMSSSDDNQEVDSASTDLEIKGILISSGELTYTDGSTDFQVKLSDLGFSSDAIKSGQPSNMSLDAQIDVAAMELEGAIDTSWQAFSLDVAPKLIFDELSFNGKMGGIPLKLNAGNEAVLDTSLDTLDIRQLIFDYANISLQTPVVGKNLSGAMRLSGGMKMSSFSLSELFDQLGSPLENQAKNMLSGEMDWSLQGNRLLLDNVQLTLDGSSINGQVDVTDLALLKGRFEFNLDALDLDQYLPEASAKVTNANVSTEAAPMDLGQMTGQIKMGQLQVAGVKMDDITLQIKTQGQNILVEPLQADFYQGLIKTELRLQPEKSVGKLQVTHSMNDFQAGGLLTDLMGTGYLTGLGQLNADIVIDEPFSDSPLQSANGTVSYRLTDGDIVGIDIYQIMEQSLSLLNKSDAVEANEELKTAFGLMDIQADVVNGVLKTEALSLTSPYFDMNGQVEVDLDKQTIKGTIKPMLTNIPEGILDERFKQLLNLRIPVKLRGNLLGPDVSIDIEKLILETQKAKIDEKKEELKEDLFDAILGTKDKKKDQESEQAGNEQSSEQPEMTEKEKKRAEKDQLKRDLLEGLFKSSKDKKKDNESDDDAGDN